MIQIFFEQIRLRLVQFLIEKIVTNLVHCLFNNDYRTNFPLWSNNFPLLLIFKFTSNVKFSGPYVQHLTYLILLSHTGKS